MKLFLLLFVLLFPLMGFTSQDLFLLERYENVAIMTDLEPDDVLALKIIFEKSNQLYVKTGKYPIDLVIVGEGNTGIKRLRMQKLLEMLNVPIAVKVVEGKSTADNLFPYDGHELFSLEELALNPSSNQSEAVSALKAFIQQSAQPCILQIKPTQELFAISFDSDLASKTTVLLYGSFNFRKTLCDQDILSHKLFDLVREGSLAQELQVLLDHFSNKFLAMGIVESYAVLGQESAVFYEYSWTHEIKKIIELADDPFMLMFKKLVRNWNAYLLEEELIQIQQEIKVIQITSVEWQTILNNLLHLRDEWDEKLFSVVYQDALSLIQTLTAHSPLQTQLINIKEKFHFANKLTPGSGVQFTLSDVALALAAVDDEASFQATPSQLKVTSQGYIEAIPDVTSNVYYYNRIDREVFARILKKYLLQQQLRIIEMR